MRSHVPVSHDLIKSQTENGSLFSHFVHQERCQRYLAVAIFPYVLIL